MYRVVGLHRASHPPEPAQAIAGYDAESAQIIEAAFRRLVAEAEPWDLELGLLRGDGQRIWVRVIGRPATEDGRVVRVSGTISDVTDRRRAEEEIRTLNAELEQRVAARTAELEQVNQELETFAYSVSHDLRAPLRAIDGFSKALLDDYAERLGEGGQRYLERVRAGVARMGTLIEELLELSRLSRQHFERVPINMSEVAREVVAELTTADPDRRVEVEIQDGLVAEADPELVRTALVNLFTNAFQFTARTERPRVRFGMLEHDGVPVYFVADNGAGFDMAHAIGLFRPFHRLHRESEFPGTGIGLATVVRAVHRHDGVIWARPPSIKADLPLHPDARRTAPRRRRHRRGRHAKVAASRHGRTPIDRGIRQRLCSSATAPLRTGRPAASRAPSSRTYCSSSCAGSMRSCWSRKRSEKDREAQACGKRESIDSFRRSRAYRRTRI